jgi:biopolymer transport protein ExbD
LTLKLPVVGSAKVKDTKPGQSLLVLNINRDDKTPNGYVSVYGGKHPDIEDYLWREARPELKKLGWTDAEIKTNVREKERPELPVLVVIRADGAAPFSLLDRVIRSCQENGFREFALRAIKGKEGGR